MKNLFWFFFILLLSFFGTTRFKSTPRGGSSVTESDNLNNFIFTLWPTYITPTNTTLNITLNPVPTVSLLNLSPIPHTVSWFFGPAGFINPCIQSANSGGYCTIQPAQKVQMLPFTLNGTYQFRDETSTKIATLVVIK
jgi:hypothetical protein